MEKEELLVEEELMVAGKVDKKKTNRYFLLILIVVVTEFFPIKYCGDLGAFVWTTFHFIVNPISCLIYLLTITIQIYKMKSIVLFDFIMLLICCLYICSVLFIDIEWHRMTNISY